ncbi:hypothetical protein RB653_000964 [Dictyostelium firmibasis]|uniref:Non-homologous end-joining factor 1 n=1 Tax=Dictyostelium firmibasis TaxID=79012 RepID=A0AAN7TXP0_9MYCE
MHNKTLTKQILEELKEKEWKPFTIENCINGDTKTLFIKSNFTHNTYSLIISDLSLVWIKHSDSVTTSNDKNRFNPHLDSPIERILNILRESINEKKSDTAYRLAINNTNNLVFTISNKISFYTFKWNFECEPIENIINSDSRKSHSEFIRDHLIIPLMFCCKNQLISNQLLTKKLDRVVNFATTSSSSSLSNNNTSNLGNININSGGVATLSVSVGTGGRNLKNYNNNSNNNKKGGIYQNILSETQKVEDFSQNDFNFFMDPIFLQYYNHFFPHDQQNINISNNDNDNNNQNDLNSTVLDIDSNDLNKCSTSNINSSTTTVSHLNSTSSSSSSNGGNGTNGESLSLFYDVELTPKKNYNLNNNSNNRNKTNSTMTSLPSSISFIPFSNSQITSSSLSSFGFPRNIDDNDENDISTDANRSNTSNNLKQQFEQQNSQELIEEKKRKLELEEKLEQSKQKQLNKKKKTKFV